MKKIIILSLITIIFHTNAYVETTQVTTAQITTKAGLVLREQPDKNSKRIHLVPAGETVNVLEEGSAEITIDNTTSKWYKIRYSDKTGWVFGGYLSFNKTVMNSNNSQDLFCYKNIKGDLIISDTSGNKSKSSLKISNGYSGRMSHGDNNPKISPDKRILSYIDNNGMINLYEIEKKTNRNLKDSIAGFSKFPKTEILITGWTKNYLVFHMSKFVAEEDYDDGKPWDGEGFYIYSVSSGKIKKHPGIIYAVSLVSDTDDIIVLNDPDSENILSSYSITSELSKDFLTLPEKYSQFYTQDMKNITYISHKQISDDYDASLIYHPISGGGVKSLITGDWAEYQFPQLFYNNQFIVYTHFYRKSEGAGFTYDEVIALYDLKNSRNKELFKSDKRITTGSNIVFKEGRFIYCYNILTDQKTVIADDAEELYE